MKSQTALSAAKTRILAIVMMALTLLPAPASAADAASTVESYTIVQGNVTTTVTIETAAATTWTVEQPAEIAAVPERYLARFGPFYVTEANKAVMVGIVDTPTPRRFAEMIKAFPGIRKLDLVEVPGTYDSDANIALARAIRRAGVATHVPANGSVRSGGVELWLAGVHRTADSGAEFAVHSWEDENGRQANDYAADAPEHKTFLAYYRDVGMTDAQAKTFYAMTNSVPFEQARYLGRDDMAAMQLLN